MSADPAGGGGGGDASLPEIQIEGATQEAITVEGGGGSPQGPPPPPMPGAGNVAVDIPAEKEEEGGTTGVGGRKIPAILCEYDYSTIKPYPLSVYKHPKVIPMLKDEVLTSIVTVFAQVPESVAFAFLAGVPSMASLHAAWIVGITNGLFGARPGMITGTTPAVSASLTAPIKALGLALMPQLVIGGAIFQLLAGALRLGRFIKLIPFSVFVGMKNGLGLVIGISQLHAFQDPKTHEYFGGWKLVIMLAVMVLTVFIVHFLPKIVSKIPSSLAAIVVGVLIETFIVRLLLKMETPTIGDVAKVERGFPTPFFLDSTYETGINGDVLRRVLGPAFTFACVGSIESLMTVEVLSDITNTHVEKPDQQLLALGGGNLLSGLLGTMGGGSMVGLSTVNLIGGASGYFRLSSVLVPLMLLAIVLGASPILNLVPTSALVGVMCIVVLHTIVWSSALVVLYSILPSKARNKLPDRCEGRKICRGDAFIILIVTVLTVQYDLFVAVGVGVVIACLEFAYATATDLHMTTQLVTDGNTQRKEYHLSGHLFFASIKAFNSKFDLENDPKEVELHLEEAVDYSALMALHEMGLKYKERGKNLTVRKLNQKSARKLSKQKSLASGFAYVEEYVLGEEMELNEPHLKVVEDDPGPVA